MKKILICLTSIALLAGCDMNKKDLKCTSTTTTNGLKTTTTYEIRYTNDEINHAKITYDYIKDNSKDNEKDGVNADTDGLTEENDDDKKDSDDVLDGAVGDAIDGTVNAVSNVLLDIKDTFNNQMNNYRDMEGFSYKVIIDSDDEYKVVYEIDLDKINNTDLSSCNIDRDFSTFKTNYENSGYTCE